MREALMDVAALISSSFCHALPERTYAAAGHALPLCARCTGVYVGLLLGFVWAWVSPLRRAAAMPRLAVWVCVAVIVLFAALGFGRLYEFVELGNAPRAGIGLAFGAVLSVMVWPVAAYWIGGAELRPWRRPQWFSFVLLLLLLPAVVPVIASPVWYVHRLVSWASLVGLAGAWLAANTLVILGLFRWRGRAGLGWCCLAFALAVVCFALEVGLLRVWRGCWAV